MRAWPLAKGPAPGPPSPPGIGVDEHQRSQFELRSHRNLGGNSSGDPDQSDNSAFGQSLGDLKPHSARIGFIEQARQTFEQEVRGEPGQRLQDLDQLPNGFEGKQGIGGRARSAPKALGCSLRGRR